MASLIVRTPFGRMVTTGNAPDRAFNDNFFGPRWTSMFEARPTGGIKLDVYEDENSYTVYALIPGVDPEKIEITALENVLTIAGQVTPPTIEGAKALWRELGPGQFRRQVTLPTEVNIEAAQATYEHGFLRLALPKSEAAKPHTVKVQVGNGNGGKTK